MKGSSRVVIIGAGVSGVRAAKDIVKLIKKVGWEIVLLDQNDYHQYLYRIHEVCNLEYEEKEIIVPISRLIDEGKVSFKKATVTSVDTKRKVVITESGEEPYSILIVALGSHPAYFNIPGIKENSYTLGSYGEAQIVRKKIMELLKNGKPVEIVVGGAGFTGVELTGELTDSLPVWYKEHKIPVPEKLVSVVEAMSSILPGWNEKLTGRGRSILEERGVKFYFNDPIVGVEPNNLKLKSGTELKFDLFIWTGGVSGDPACGIDFDIRSRRIIIDDFCRAEGFDDIFVAGDMACTTDLKDIPQPPTAHIAMVQGNIVARNVAAMINGEAMIKYGFQRAGEIVTLGRTNAIGELFGIQLYGFAAKLMKKIVHYWYVYTIGGVRLLLS